MTGEATATKDHKCVWLLSLYAMVTNLSLLRSNYRTICYSEPAKYSKSVIDSTYTAEMELGRLVLKLMDTWGISHKELIKWMDCEPDALLKHMNSSGFIVSPSSNSHHGRTRKSPKR